MVSFGRRKRKEAEQSSHEVSPDDLRKLAWPYLLGQPPAVLYHASSPKDADQIAVDVARCTWHLLTGSQRSQFLQMQHKREAVVARTLRRRQRRLARVLHASLSAGRYFQGYHDVAAVHLTILGKDRAISCLRRVTESHWKDAMKANFLDLQEAIRCTVYPLLAIVDAEVLDHVLVSDVPPFFCLGWLITWFAHDVRDAKEIARLYDFFLVSHPLLPLYVTVALMEANRNQILATDPHDFAQVHHCLSQLPRNSNAFGWKYRPGDGYISDTGVDEDNEAETSMMSLDGDDLDLTETSSFISDDWCEPPPAVPFQQVLDRAVDLLHEVPPRDVPALAEKFYGSPIDVSSITLFQEAPAWSTAASIPSCTTTKKKHRDWTPSPASLRARTAVGLGPSGRLERLRVRRQQKRVQRAMLFVGTLFLLYQFLVHSSPPHEDRIEL